MKLLVKYDKSSGATLGYIHLTTDSDAQFYPDCLEIPLNHPAQYDQANWKVQKGKLVQIKNG